MNKLFSFLALLLVSTVSGFAPIAKPPTTLNTNTQLEAAPTMSAIDYVGYASGQTDKFQGTGVFSGIKMEREPEKKEDDSKLPAEKKEYSSQK
ncbi:unnamed protein product [Cylindrotheca closterium]|uniref:PS II complex 12 kDa extrinsic protein n=1 Tax=Cylindrotheca closterium TaxID=2856 RepID=A0AAD2CXR5_9STRA|nr:unnamed protein product [Cylindrotheca closterium]